jgi:hypothetical protein
MDQKSETPNEPTGEAVLGQPGYIQQAITALKRRTQRALSPWVQGRLEAAGSRSGERIGPSVHRRPALTTGNVRLTLNRLRSMTERATVWKPGLGALEPAAVQQFTHAVADRVQAVELMSTRRQPESPASPWEPRRDGWGEEMELTLAVGPEPSGAGAAPGELTAGSRITGPSIFSTPGLHVPPMVRPSRPVAPSRAPSRTTGRSQPRELAQQSRLFSRVEEISPGEKASSPADEDLEQAPKAPIPPSPGVEPGRAVEPPPVGRDTADGPARSPGRATGPAPVQRKKDWGKSMRAVSPGEALPAAPSLEPPRAAQAPREAESETERQPMLPPELGQATELSPVRREAEPGREPRTEPPREMGDEAPPVPPVRPPIRRQPEPEMALRTGSPGEEKGEEASLARPLSLPVEREAEPGGELPVEPIEIEEGKGEEEEGAPPAHLALPAAPDQAVEPPSVQPEARPMLELRRRPLREPPPVQPEARPEGERRPRPSKRSAEPPARPAEPGRDHLQGAIAAEPPPVQRGTEVEVTAEAQPPQAEIEPVKVDQLEMGLGQDVRARAASGARLLLRKPLSSVGPKAARARPRIRPRPTTARASGRDASSILADDKARIQDRPMVVGPRPPLTMLGLESTHLARGGPTGAWLSPSFQPVSQPPSQPFQPPMERLLGILEAEARKSHDGEAMVLPTLSRPTPYPREKPGPGSGAHSRPLATGPVQAGPTAADHAGEPSMPLAQPSTPQPTLQRQPEPAPEEVSQRESTSPAVSSVVGAPHTMVQRVEAEAEDEGGEFEELDLADLAQRVYPFIKRLLLIERERRPGRLV